MRAKLDTNVSMLTEGLSAPLDDAMAEEYALLELRLVGVLQVQVA